MPSKSTLLVISPLDAAQQQALSAGVVLSEAEQRLDAMDEFNHPRLRRGLILQQLVKLHQEDGCVDMEFRQARVATDDEDDNEDDDTNEDWVTVYQKVHTAGLVDFLATAWKRWEILGPVGQDPSARCQLVPSCMPLPRESWQRPSQNVIGQMGYYCTEVGTPVYEALVRELSVDAASVRAAVEAVTSSSYSTAYVMTTHPGHHAAADSFGGYCYVNSVGAAARLLQDSWEHHDDKQEDDDSGSHRTRIAILDVDYHAGNGTASIFYEDPAVLMVSLHCDPDCDYPFHTGFADQTGHGAGEGTTLHLPMPPGTTWEASYQEHLQTGLGAIRKFTPRAVLVSLGLDTHVDDPCADQRAGFALQGEDYKAMGRLLADGLPAGVPVLFFQEGGYRMDKIGEAAANVVTSFCQHRSVA